MNMAIEFQQSTSSEEALVTHLRACDADFIPPLSSRVEISDYAKKIVGHANRFEAWSGRVLVGLVAAYCNDQDKLTAYITSVSLLKEWTGKGIGSRLMEQCIEYAKSLGIRQIDLEVATDNTSAIRFYETCGFVSDKLNMPFVTMSMCLYSGDEHDHQT